MQLKRLSRLSASLFASVMLTVFLLLGAQGCSHNRSTTAVTPSIHNAEPGSGHINRRIAAADNGFGLKLFARLHELNPSENLLISPSSAALCIAMAYNGSDGTTRAAIARTLELQHMTMQNVNRSNADLMAELNHPDSDVSLKVANSMWVSSRFPLDDQFAGRIRQYYGTAPASLDFTKPDASAVINRWVDKVTDGAIPSIVDAIQPSEPLILVNAVYFKGTWSQPFELPNTTQGIFSLTNGQTCRTPLMREEGRFLYFDTKTLQAIQLPYGSGRLALNVFLPRPDSSLAAMVSGLDAQRWNKWMLRFDRVDGSISLPRFKMGSALSLDKALGGLGMGDAFQEGHANFSGISKTRSLFIGGVRHETTLDVNETGTVAAAATSITMKASATERPGRTFNMIVNRPFLLAITDRESGAILFMGVLQNPAPGRANYRRLTLRRRGMNSGSKSSPGVS